MTSDATTELSEALARLVTDSELRRSFTSDPAALCMELSLGRASAQALCGIDVAQLTRFADSLLVKRRDEFARVVPLTLRVGPSIAGRYAAWLAVHPSTACDGVLGPGEAEALRALPALRAELLRDEVEAVYAGELLAWETFGAATRRDGRARAFDSDFALQEIARDVARGLIPTDPTRARHRFELSSGGVRWSRAP